MVSREASVSNAETLDIVARQFLTLDAPGKIIGLFQAHLLVDALGQPIRV